MVHQPKKKIRKNYFKNSRARHRTHRLQRLAGMLRVAFGVTAVAVMSLLFIFGYALLTQSSYFQATQFNVAGLDRLSAQEILHQAGLSDGINIFSVNLPMTRKMLLAHPWIADAEISREIPSGIRIRIREHEPLAIIDMHRKFLINRQGEIFKEWKAADPVNLPVVSGLQFSDLNVGSRTFSQPFSAVMSVLKLGQKDGSVLANHQIRKIEIDKDIGLTIQVDNAVGTIKLGYDDYASKYKRLQQVLYYFRSGKQLENVKSIDLNNPDRIVVDINTQVSPAVGHKEV